MRPSKGVPHSEVGVFFIAWADTAVMMVYGEYAL